MSSLTQVREKIKTKQELWLVPVIILTASLAFGLGRLSASSNNKSPILINTNTSLVNASQPAGGGEPVAPVLTTPEGQYVGSKTSDKYHLPWCGGAKRIKEENKVWFTSKAEAEAAGYTAASNCPGLQ